MSAITIPSLSLETGTTPPDPKAIEWSVLNDQTIYITDHGLRPAPTFLELEFGDRFCIAGRPILGDTVDAAGTCRLLQSSGFSDSALQQLNGEFLILHSPPDRRALRVVTCRFGYPTFWLQSDARGIVAATSFFAVWQRLRQLDRIRVNPDSFFETLLFKRVFGDKTPDANTKLLGPAQQWVYDGKSIRTQRYWRPDFTKKSTASPIALADQLIDLVRQSVRRRVTSGGRFSLFLSGGMDTRLVAACLAREKVPAHCITINAFENREVVVARQVAAITGLPHTFLATPPGHYQTTLPQAIQLCAGMHMPMCMFHGHSAALSDIADIGFHGHGFDFMFQGMYIPKTQLHIAGKTLAYRRMAPLPADIVSYFLNHAPYRLKGLNILDCGHAGVIKTQIERLRAELGGQLREIQEYAPSPYDSYEQLTFSNFARHYSVSDHWGINTNLEQQTICFDNDLLDFYTSLSAHDRFDARIQRMALQRLSPALAELQSANHTYPIRLSSGERTLRQIGNAILRRIGMAKPPADNRFERMGLPHHHLFQHDWRDAILDLAQSPRLESIPFINGAKVSALARDAAAGNHPADGQFLALCMAVDQFLKTAA